MPWFKVDDRLHTHPKWLGLPKGPKALWITAGSWCAGQMLDGFVPATALRSLNGTRAEADRLVEAGLWEETDGGWRFHDWTAYQPTKKSVEERRSKDAERLREWRANRAEGGA